MDKDEEVPQEVYTKELAFKEYSSLELATRDKFINLVRKANYDEKDILWVASEKIHGSNFSIHFNGETARYGRRTDFCSKEIPIPCDNPGELFSETFHDARNLVKKFHNRLGDIFANIKALRPQTIKVSIYGEYFGGLWPENHPAYVKGPKAVQKGVYYTPHHEFMAFDVCLISQDKAQWADVLDIPNLLKEYMPSVPVYAKGTFEEMFNIETVIDSTIPELLGLPKLEKNVIEGLVIRPNSNLNLPMYNQRVVIKKKNAEFLEKASAPNPNKEKKEKKEKQLDPEIAPYVEELSKYLNFNRIDSVMSKFPDLKDRNKIKELVFEDMIGDANKDEVKMHPQEEKQKKVVQEIKTRVMKEINSYFVKH